MASQTGAPDPPSLAAQAPSAGQGRQSPASQPNERTMCGTSADCCHESTVARGRGVVLSKLNPRQASPLRLGESRLSPMTTSLHLAVLGTHPGSWGEIVILVAMLTEDFIEAFVLR